LVVAAAGCKIVLKLERKTAVRAHLKERNVLAVLPPGYGPRKKRFCRCQRRFQKALHRFAREFQGSVNIPQAELNYKSEEEALRNTRQLKQWNSEN